MQLNRPSDSEFFIRPPTYSRARTCTQCSTGRHLQGACKRVGALVLVSSLQKRYSMMPLKVRRASKRSKRFVTKLQQRVDCAGCTTPQARQGDPRVCCASTEMLWPTSRPTPLATVLPPLPLAIILSLSHSSSDASLTVLKGRR